MPNLFNTVKHGYNPEEVDNYIKILEDVIKDYKDKDNAIRNAIVNAQVAADNIIKNSELAADDIKYKTIEHLDDIADSIEKQRQIIESFQQEYNELLLKYLTRINETDFENLYAKIDNLKTFIDSLKNTRLYEADVLEEQEEAYEPQEEPYENGENAYEEPRENKRQNY